MKLPYRLLALCAISFPGACGGGGDVADAVGTSALDGATVLMTVRSEAAGSHCTNGAGFDADANGLLA